MGTKNEPGAFDCYANAEPDEMMFVLLARDRLGGALVRVWAAAREAMGGEDAAKIEEARRCADVMDAQCRALGKEPINITEIVSMVAKHARAKRA